MQLLQREALLDLPPETDIYHVVKQLYCLEGIRTIPRRLYDFFSRRPSQTQQKIRHYQSEFSRLLAEMPGVDKDRLSAQLTKDQELFKRRVWMLCGSMLVSVTMIGLGVKGGYPFDDKKIQHGFFYSGLVGFFSGFLGILGHYKDLFFKAKELGELVTESLNPSLTV
jgi:hypothetical protein